MEEAQKKLESELNSFKCTQRELQKAVSSRQQLDAQLNENQIVKEELDRLPNDRKVYKAVGPALIKTEIIEAKQNVAKRIDYITNEIKRFEELIMTLEQKQDGHREAIQKVQHQFQQAKMKTAMKS